MLTMFCKRSSSSAHIYCKTAHTIHATEIVAARMCLCGLPGVDERHRNSGAPGGGEVSDQEMSGTGSAGQLPAFV